MPFLPTVARQRVGDVMTDLHSLSGVTIISLVPSVMAQPDVKALLDKAHDRIAEHELLVRRATVDCVPFSMAVRICRGEKTKSCMRGFL